jgi:hypothetical protein
VLYRRRLDFSLVQLPVLDNDGYPIQKRGVTDHPGLYFVGLPWLHNARSGLLSGLAQDAGHIATAINEEASRREFARRLPRDAAARPKGESEFVGKVAQTQEHFQEHEPPLVFGNKNIALLEFLRRFLCLT